MRNYFININCKALAVLMGLIIIASVVPLHAKDDFKLKSGAKGALCLECHQDFKETLKKRYVHTPVQIGECSGCHNPHTSSHDKLLDTESSKLCFNCHKKIIPDNPRSAHSMVLNGNCGKCHDPHASANKSVLLKAGNELCYDCHKDIGEKINQVRFRHRPVNEDCLSCHNPHASEKYASLLKNDATALCKTCHNPDRAVFTRQHMNYPVADSRCNSCHDSHGSNKAMLMYDDVHEPVAQKKCTECHAEPGSSQPLATRKNGIDLCRQCHSDMINATFSRNRIHWPLLDKEGCLNCHSAHAARQKKLLSGSVTDVCKKCHADTVELQEVSKKNPKNTTLCEPVKKGNCISCHSPHSADYTLLTPTPSISMDVCGKCHEWKSHSTHPIGDKFVDPRNKNLITDCMSCHKACGTGNKPRMTHFETVTETCVQCHKELRR